ncbi:MAG: NAD(P)/FAD-dependent oxidoreductase [Acidobacteriota bacterium]|nr:NAD(P)/FAD-dependent oxidoreductase [Acidobacteriota bacterium]
MAHKVVIIGGGFGGLNAAKDLKHAKAEVCVIDRRNFHLFQPLLYQVATGALSPGEIAAPIRSVLRRNKNTTVLLGDVNGFDAAGKNVMLADGGEVPYDTLIVSAGTTDNYFGHPEWAELAPGLKGIENATAIRSRMLMAFENAERTHDPAKRKAFLTFVVIGGGATGTEMSGAISEIARDIVIHDFRSIDTREAEVIMVEGSPRVLNSYPEDLSKSAEDQLHRLGVKTRLSTMVTEIDKDGVTVKSNGREERIAAKTVIWAAGVRASPLGKMLGEQTGAEVDKMGRVVVEPDLSLRGHPEILVIGDLASFSYQTGKPLPGVAQVAIQMGAYAAKLVRARLNKETIKPFHYWDKGNMATIGRAAAVAQIGKLHVSGLLAWILWLFIHLMYLVGFQNRIVVLLEWIYNYVTMNRGARLITGDTERISPEKVVS